MCMISLISTVFLSLRASKQKTVLAVRAKEIGEAL
jgi:hypothetical protein